MADLEAQLATARETNARLNRRCQQLEATLPDWQMISQLTREQRSRHFSQLLIRHALSESQVAHERALSLGRKLYDALKGCAARLRVTLGHLNGDPFEGDAPGALENINAVGDALKAWDDLAATGEQVTPLADSLRTAFVAVEDARSALIRAGHPSDGLLAELKKSRDAIAAELLPRKEAQDVR